AECLWKNAEFRATKRHLQHETREASDDFSRSNAPSGRDHTASRLGVLPLPTSQTFPFSIGRPASDTPCSRFQGPRLLRATKARCRSLRFLRRKPPCSAGSKDN